MNALAKVLSLSEARALKSLSKLINRDKVYEMAMGSKGVAFPIRDRMATARMTSVSDKGGDLSSMWNITKGSKPDPMDFGKYSIINETKGTADNATGLKILEELKKMKEKPGVFFADGSEI